MLKSTPIPIRAIVGHTKKKPTDILARLNAVLAGVYTYPEEYPNPPVDEATFKSNTDTFSSDITAALDGGAKAIAARNAQETVVVGMLHEIGHFAEVKCKGNMSTFLKSGFAPVPNAKAVFQPLSQFIRNIRHGASSGQLLVTIVAVPKAASYEFRWAAVGAGGVSGPWTTIPVTKANRAIPVTGLTPGTTYAFQVRSLGDAGYSDWSDSLTKISI
ncbi:MAG TPA: fibronectin type III domain-containing protein [Terriglobia bacterium]|jgi:hypothetical protein